METLAYETLVQIFEHLRYFDLLSITGVCKRFRDIVKTNKLDLLLFHGEAPLDFPKSTREVACPVSQGRANFRSGYDEYIYCWPDIRLGDEWFFEPRWEIRNADNMARFNRRQWHPVFKRLEYNLGDSIDDVTFKKNGRKIMSASVANENAVRPPVPELVLHVSHYEPFWVRADSAPGSAVTVAQVMQAVVDCYNASCTFQDYDSASQERSPGYWSPGRGYLTAFDTVYDADPEADDPESQWEEGQYYEEETKHFPWVQMVGPRKNWLRWPNKENYKFPGVSEGMHILGTLHLFIPRDREYTPPKPEYY